MRVAFYGNTCNNFYAVARALRRTGDIDAHLFVDADADFNQLPESEEPALRSAYPEWIHRGTYQTYQSRLWPGASPLVRALATFDLVMVSGAGVRFAPFVDRPFIFYVTGWDLTVAPFPVRFFDRPRGPAAKVAAVIGGFWQRRGIGCVDELWSQPFSPFTLAASRLGIDSRRVTPRYFPIIIDTELFQPSGSPRAGLNGQMRRVLDEHDFVVFHPSRIMTDRRARYVESGQWKGNDRLFEGFARFAESTPSARPALVLIDREESPDVREARHTIRRLGIDDRVTWLKGPHPYGFDRVELVPLYAAADVVVDEFGIGWFGSVVVEGLSMAKPVLCYLDPDVMEQLYPWHPILTPQTPDEIAACLVDLWRDPVDRQRLGERSRRWAVEFHSIEGASATYIEHVRQAIRDRT